MSRKRVCMCLHVHVCPYVFLFPLCLSTRTLPRRRRPQGPSLRASDGGDGKASASPPKPRAVNLLAPASSSPGTRHEGLSCTHLPQLDI